MNSNSHIKDKAIAVVGELNRRFDELFTSLLTVPVNMYKDQPILRIRTEHFMDSLLSNDCLVVEYLMANHMITLTLEVDASVMFAFDRNVRDIANDLYDEVIFALVSNAGKLMKSIGKPGTDSYRTNMTIQCGHLYFVVTALGSKSNRWGHHSYHEVLQKGLSVKYSRIPVADLEQVRYKNINAKLDKMISLCHLNEGVSFAVATHLNVKPEDLNQEVQYALVKVKSDSVERNFIMLLVRLILHALYGNKGDEMFRYFWTSPYDAASSISFVTNSKYRNVIAVTMDLFIYANAKECRCMWEDFVDAD